MMIKLFQIHPRLKLITKTFICSIEVFWAKAKANKSSSSSALQFFTSSYHRCRCHIIIIIISGWLDERTVLICCHCRLKRKKDWVKVKTEERMFPSKWERLSNLTWDDAFGILPHSSFVLQTYWFSYELWKRLSLTMKNILGWCRPKWNKYFFNNEKSSEFCTPRKW